jgi:DNA-directed RNA polymerase subunit RPC12/RpoP
MSYWTIIENPSQEMLDSLLSTEKGRVGKCPDCGVDVGEEHYQNCDVARCTKCGGQYISCDCSIRSKAIDNWSGLWPGVQYAYDHKLVCKDPAGNLSFDLNRVAVLTHKK